MDELIAGEVGIVVANVKDVHDAKVGDTITEEDAAHRRAVPRLQGGEADGLLGRLPDRGRGLRERCATRWRSSRLNDSAFTYEPETSQALGFGFRCGYLGLLHMEIVQERLEREYELSLITTAPSVVYRVTDTAGEVQEIDNPAKLPPVQKIAQAGGAASSPATSTLAPTIVGAILKLCQDRRGVQKDLKYLGTKRVQITYDIPLAEVVFDFFDKLKSVSRGYASLDYELKGYEEADLVKLDILINGEPVDALSRHRPPRARLPARPRPVREAQARSSRSRCTRWPSRRPSAPRSSPARRSRPSARTSSPSATVATSPASASSSRSRRRARSA